MEILYLNSKDIEEINLTNDEIINAVEDSLKAQGKEKPPLSRGFISIRIRNTTDILMSRGYIEPKHAVGVKIVGDYVFNYEKNLPSEMSLLNLFDPETGAPYAVIDATAITTMRTGGNNRGWG